MKKAFWLILLPLLSCLDQPDCIRTSDTALVIDFRKLLTGEKDTTILLQVTAAGADSIFYSPGNVPDTLRGVSAILAINPFDVETLYTFYLPGRERTLRVGYTKEARFISEDCGSEIFYSSLHVIDTEFDSVRIVNNQLTKNRFVNIEIFK
ncbi:MAG: hypothetical protein KF846_16470 [Cyclobacteriaceae bacterium]|nr:hypothetical protein [Cyclobacteriaceae bacterium]MBX2957761.1 hypothetical protein [Cyclobacteriaceae bacterium]